MPRPHIEEPARVLHVDDEPDFAGMVATLLERAEGRFEVTTARSADAGLEHLAENEVDCVVSDYDMPGEDGLAFLERVRSEYGDLPFVPFTGKGSGETASEAVSAGVTDYLQKSGRTDRYELLARRVANAVERRRAERRLESERRRFGKLTEHSTDVIVVVDERLRFSYVSASVEPILGHDPADPVGEEALPYVHPEDRDIARKRLSEGVEHPGTPVSEVRLVNADSGRYVEANEAACELFGLEREALLGRRIEAFAPDDYDVEAAWSEFRAAERERDTFPLVRPDGEVRTVEYAATADVVPGEHLSVLRGVTGRESAGEAGLDGTGD
ncbi:hypothetical protein BRC93_02855 [Halobacteriales archaeon QS_5_70_15]|nr:MAG: hypothetical protein BRC93_02855 [Halobacteriales archaeon QS_5_70_15]